MIYFAATFLVTITSLSSPQTLCRTMVPALTGAVSTTLRISSITGKIISLGMARVRRTLVTGSSPPLTSTELAMVRRGRNHYRDCRIVVRQNGVEVAAKKMKKAIPAEMIQFKVSAAKLQEEGALEVSVE